jgi:ferric-dicitrate binding protein FerR (iron transport regulator)
MDLQNPEPEDLLCDESFQRFCMGEEIADVLFWEHWIETHPDKITVVSNAKRLFEMLHAGQSKRREQLAALKDALGRRERLKKVVLNGVKAQLPEPAPVVKPNRKAFMRYAAAIAVLLATSTLLYIRYGGRRIGSLHNYNYYTSQHSRRTIMLPDSSVIMLNENSHLSISRNFDARHREVTITGEAFFDVKHDAAHPFVVHTRAYSIRVLGTSFNVRSYPGRKETETDLISGKVEIVPNAGRRQKEKIILRPREKFVLEQAAVAGNSAPSSRANAFGRGRIAPLHIDTITHRAPETSWMRRKMEIKDETFEQIAKKLQAWYGIKITFAGEAAKHYRYTATFDDESILKVLQYLQQTYPFSYKIEQDTIVITQS